MLSDKILETEDLIGEYQVAQYRLKKYKEYLSFLNELKALDKKFTKYYNMFKMLNKKDPTLFKKLSMDDYIKVIDEYLTNLAREESLSKSKLKTLETNIAEKDEKLKAKWRSYAENSSSDVLSTLQMIKNIFSDKMRITRITYRIESMTRKWPFDKDEMEDFQHAIEDAKKLIDDINAGEEVQKFLQLVATGEATLEDISKEILEWLKKNNFTTNLSLNFK